MAYLYLPPPSITQWQEQFATFLSKFGYDVSITVKRGEVERHTIEIAAYSALTRGLVEDSTQPSPECSGSNKANAV